MKKTYCLDINYILIFIFILVLLLYIICSYYIQNQCLNCNINDDDAKIQYYKQNELENKITNIQNKLENYENNPNNREPIINTINYPTAVINRDPKSLNALDRIYNPLKYPYKSPDFYDQGWYPNLELPFQVIGGGYRNTPTLGGTQIPIYNPPVPINISNKNIAPVYISTQGPQGQPQQIGTIYKINGNDNDYLPLFGRRLYPNDNKYDYYTMVGNFGTKVKVITKNKNYELGNNDVVFLKGKSDPYRVTIYETDFPQYIPYI